ncbi:MAG: histidine phosphatase family protein [Balneolaceae bacterium]|nr:histidine phosphatase family protein [Balneolaceae bacterium]MBO6545196.1 histidine phosphatase family protein [Balneolaceae bacterium]MBO6646592.1 histidine phosphatase family protein [Balneolaceae bacterium]
MKFILLLRHAKSSWSDPSLDDFDRPLAGRGLKDAPRMGKYLKKAGYRPDYIVSSPAQRALQTTKLCAEAMKRDESIIRWEESLYFESAGKYVEAIRKTPEQAETMMLVGHNPLMESAATILSGGRESTAFRIPTAGLVCLESYAVRWQDIKPGTCQVKWMMIPKVLKGIVD